jgi:hypothetical protein
MDDPSDQKSDFPDEARLATIRVRIDEYNAERPGIALLAHAQVAVLMGGMTIRYPPATGRSTRRMKFTPTAPAPPGR